MQTNGTGRGNADTDCQSLQAKRMPAAPKMMPGDGIHAPPACVDNGYPYDGHTPGVRRFPDAHECAIRGQDGLGGDSYTPSAHRAVSDLPRSGTVAPVRTPMQ
ncbi:MAG TPA: hypothetical protein VJ654_02275 [Noviherbaspirillum sp.]|nr:hypothetical protein [Noviherbaspirillum sp.]